MCLIKDALISCASPNVRTEKQIKLILFHHETSSHITRKLLFVLNHNMVIATDCDICRTNR